MAVCYCITTIPGRARSYVGVTNDLERRLRQHRRELVGGAAATGRVMDANWELGCYVSGFATRKHALQFEWRWQRGGERRRRRYPATRVSYSARLKHLGQTLALERVTRTAPLTHEQTLVVHHKHVL